MAKRSHKRSHKRHGRKKAHRGSRKHRRQEMYGGEFAPVNYTNPGPMDLNLAQGRQYAEFHQGQHGGAFMGGPYPGAVTDTALPNDLRASAHLLPLDKAFADVRGLTDQQGGRKKRRGSRKSRKGSRKSRKGRKGSRKQRGGLYRWGGGALGSMPVAESGNMLISPSQVAQAGLNPEWKLAQDPMAFAPRR